MTRIALFAAFVATVVAANWALGRYGIVPVGFGLEAPAGVYFAGLATAEMDQLMFGDRCDFECPTCHPETEETTGTP